MAFRWLWETPFKVAVNFNIYRERSETNRRAGNSQSPKIDLAVFHSVLYVQFILFS